MVDIRVPDGLWDITTIPEGVVANWFFNDGSGVVEGATVAEVVAEKSSFDITAPKSGTLKIIVAKDGVVIPGTVIARIEDG